jgi:hypothetical protein
MTMEESQSWQQQIKKILAYYDNLVTKSAPRITQTQHNK